MDSKAEYTDYDDEEDESYTSSKGKACKIDIYLTLTLIFDEMNRKARRIKGEVMSK